MKIAVISSVKAFKSFIYEVAETDTEFKLVSTKDHVRGIRWTGYIVLLGTERLPIDAKEIVDEIKRSMDDSAKEEMDGHGKLIH